MLLELSKSIALIRLGKSFCKTQPKQDKKENTHKYYPTTERCSLLSGFQCNAIASLDHLAHKKNELEMEVHRVGGQRSGCHRSVVG